MKLMHYALAAIATIATVAIAGTAVQAHSTQTGSCLDPKSPNSFEASFTRGTGTIETVDGKALCADSELFLQSFKLPATWDGKGWNRTAIPQSLHAAIPFTVPGGQKNFKKTITISVPDACHATQLDFYFAPVVPAIINYHDGEDREILGEIFKATGKCETPKTIKVCELATKKLVTINEKDFDSKKHSKNLADCNEVKTIEVCELSTKKVITINEKDFDSKKHSKTLTDCDTVPPVTPPELPKTGAGEMLLSVVGLGALVASSYYYVVSRRVRA